MIVAQTSPRYIPPRIIANPLNNEWIYYNSVDRNDTLSVAKRRGLIGIRSIDMSKIEAGKACVSWKRSNPDNFVQTISDLVQEIGVPSKQVTELLRQRSVWGLAFTDTTYNSQSNNELLARLGCDLLAGAFTNYLLTSFPNIQKEQIKHAHERYLSIAFKADVASILELPSLLRTKRRSTQQIRADCLNAMAAALYETISNG